MKRYLLVLVLTVIVSFSVFPQFENVQYSQITARAGLPDNVVTCIFKDSKGFMWFGTTRGLARYDGYQFKVFSHDPLDTTSITSNTIYQIYEDRSGNFWVTNSSGLNKFDTRKLRFKDIPYRQLLPGSGDHSILSLSPGDPGKLYLATWSGHILELDINTETLKKINLDSGNPDFNIDDKIVDFQITTNGLAWVCTFGTGLYAFDSKDDFRLIHHYRFYENDKLSLTTDTLATLFEDSKGDIWVTSFNGLNRITPPGRNGEKGEVQRFYRKHDKSNSLPDNEVFAIKEDGSGILWLRSARGIGTYNRETGQFNHWPHQYSGVNSFTNFFTAQTLLIDSLGSVWFSIGTTGISRLSFHKNKFDLIRHDPKDDNSLIDNGVSNILQDTSGVLWVATWNQGLDKRVPGENGQEARWYHYRHDPYDPTSIPTNTIRTVFRDSRGDLWLGSDDAGLIRLVDTGNGKVAFKNFLTDFAANDQGNRMDVITEDARGNLWVGGRGFFLFDRESETFYRYVTDTASPDTLPVEWVSSMAPDPSGATWLGTWGVGLVKIEPPYKRVGKYITGTTISYKNDEDSPKDLRDWGITTVLVPSVHTDVLLSIGTTGGGLFELRKTTDQQGKIKEYFTNYSVKDGLQSYYIQGIEEDAYGNIWISTQDGLSKFDPVTGIIVNFNTDDGLPANEFGWLSHYTSPDGKLYYYLDGLLSFYPDSLHSNPNVPPVFITGLNINNKPLEPGEHSALTTDLSETREITLSHEQNTLSLDFAALNYYNQEENRYKYKLEGIDDDWVDAGTEHTASYQGLQPGIYTFRVIGSNNDGVWNTEGASLKIIIRPPWWRTIPAILSYILLLVVAFLGLFKIRERKLLYDKKKLEQMVAERTEELQEVNVQLEEHHEELEQQKEELQQTLDYLKETQSQLVQSEKLASIGQLTAGIAHEINNPVNYINGGIVSLEINLREIREILDLYHGITPENVQEKLIEINDLKERLDYNELLKEVEQLTGSIKSGSARTTEIIKGLRTFSRLDENEIKPADIHEGIDLTLVMLHNKAKHHVEIKKEYGELPLVECFPGKLNQVFMNILSNAIEAITGSGTIIIKTWEDKPGDKVLISIKDDGEGMSEKTLSNIFNPFFTTKDVGKGTGLGLSISHGIIEQHKGTIRVKSKPGEGAEFIISLPVHQKN